jgi:tetratricopeptide (TPR) repeat protein
LPGTERGIEFAKGGDMARAVAAFQEVVALHSTTARAHYNLGLALLCQGRYDEAIASLDLAYGMTASRKYGAQLVRAREWKANAERLRRRNSAGTGAP